jgi:hypothetical protein
LGEVDSEIKSGKGRRNSKTDFSCSKLHGVFNGGKTGFKSSTDREIFGKEKREKWETKNSPPYVTSFFSTGGGRKRHKLT